MPPFLSRYSTRRRFLWFHSLHSFTLCAGEQVSHTWLAGHPLAAPPPTGPTARAPGSVKAAMSFPTKDERKKCWDSRDRYWDCLDTNKEERERCLKQRQAYETSCPAQWVKHFDRKRNYLKFKDRIEKEGYEPLKN